MVDGIAALLTMEVNRGITRVVRGLLVRPVLTLEALVAGPRPNQGAVNRKVLGGEQTEATGMRQHLSEQGLGDIGGNSRSRFFGEHR
jgi:hypothetical protein